MRGAGIRDLKNNLSRYLRALRPGQAIAVTDRGRVIAELRAPGPAAASLSGRYAALVSSGVIRLASQSGDPLADAPGLRALALPSGTVSALLGEDRGE